MLINFTFTSLKMWFAKGFHISNIHLQIHTSKHITTPEIEKVFYIKHITVQLLDFRKLLKIGIRFTNLR